MLRGAAEVVCDHSDKGYFKSLVRYVRVFCDNTVTTNKRTWLMAYILDMIHLDYSSISQWGLIEIGALLGYLTVTGTKEASEWHMKSGNKLPVHCIPGMMIKMSVLHNVDFHSKTAAGCSNNHLWNKIWKAWKTKLSPACSVVLMWHLSKCRNIVHKSWKSWETTLCRG